MGLATDIGKRVREERKKQGISQESLAAQAGIDRSYLGRIERGEVNVTVQTLWSIKGVLGVSISDLISDYIH